MTSSTYRAYSGIAILAAAILSSGTAMAQDAASIDAKLAANAPAVASDGETGTDALNRQAAAAAAAQNAANNNSVAAYRQAVAIYQAQRAAAAQAQADYEAALAANRQARADYDAAYARWQADVAACTGGDTSRCATAQPKN